MLEPIYDTGSVETSTQQQKDRGWHDHRRQVIFPPGTSKLEVEAFAAGLKAADRGFSMWFSFTVGEVADGYEHSGTKIPKAGVVLDIKSGWDSGD